MRDFILGFLAAMILAVAAFWLFKSDEPKTGSHVTEKTRITAQKWQCPMHPYIISDRPGNCPICGMKLVPMKDQESDKKPGTPQTAAEPLPEGYTTVKISPEKVQLIGVTYGEVKEMQLDQSIRTVGRVVPDETRLHHIHTKFEGYIEDLYVDYVGEFVKKGSALFSVYSPELVATQQEYLLAMRASKSLGETGRTLLEAARSRLSLWDIGPEQIAKIEKTGEPIRALVIRSPVAGYVIAKTAFHGMKITPADTLYDIIDLSNIWVMADIYEVNLPFIKVGMPATVTLPYDPGKSWSGRVTFVNPVLDPESRTVKARIEIKNPDNTLKPDMYTHVSFGGVAGKGLVVPESAVISTGERMIVFVVKEEGLFVPREVTAGVKVRNYYQITSGLRAGEKVVTSGNFLLDSESKLKAAVSGASGEHKH